MHIQSPPPPFFSAKRIGALYGLLLNTMRPLSNNYWTCLYRLPCQSSTAVPAGATQLQHRCYKHYSWTTAPGAATSPGRQLGKTGCSESKSKTTKKENLSMFVVQAWQLWLFITSCSLLHLTQRTGFRWCRLCLR